MSKTLRLGTRGSPLALAQANLVRDALLAAHMGCEVEIVAMTASGDRIQDRALADVGGKALWTKELDAALLAGEIDFAVHSMKDVETIRPPEIVIAAMLERADVRDRLIGAESISALPQGARIGTSSPRRTAQLLRRRPDLKPVLFRGNVQTRLAKLEAGEADATLLAAAGLARLGIDAGQPIEMDEILPAPAQGSVGIEALAANTVVRKLLDAINHVPTYTCVMAERVFLAALKADCRSPVAAYAQIDDEFIEMRGEILSADGQLAQSGAAMFAIEDADGPVRFADHLLSTSDVRLRSQFG